MKVQHFLLTIALTALAMSCGSSDEENGADNGSSENETAEVQLPAEKSLSPYDFALTAPVTAENLYNEAIAWEEGWNGKEVTVIAWIGGGMSTGPTKNFSNEDNPGLIVLKANILEGGMAKMADIGGTASHIILKGKTRDGGNALMLDEAVIVGAYNDEVPSGQELSLELAMDTPVNPVDVLNSINAWNGVEVAIQDRCSIPMKGNAISFRKDGEKIVSARFDTEFNNRTPSNEVRTIQGKVSRVDVSRGVSLSECRFAD